MGMLFLCISLILDQNTNKEHKHIARIIWEFGRYEKCARGSCIISKTHLHEESEHRGWRICRPSGKIVILCGLHPFPRVTQFS